MIAKKITSFNSMELPKLSCQIFPNPTNHQISLTIQTSKLLPVSITISNTLGQIVLHKILASAHQMQDSILIDGWAAGMYFIQVSNNEETIVQKIIKY
jgi:hypothetical protein